MNSTMRRVMTVIGGTAGVIALSGGTAFAHYCYRTDVPEGSKMAKGSAWHTQDEMIEAFGGFPLPDDCKARIIAHIDGLPDGTLFMGPGLLAGGAIPQGKGPEGVGHLFQDAMAFPECAPIFAE